QQCRSDGRIALPLLKPRGGVDLCICASNGADTAALTQITLLAEHDGPRRPDGSHFRCDAGTAIRLPTLHPSDLRARAGITATTWQGRISAEASILGCTAF